MVIFTLFYILGGRENVRNSRKSRHTIPEKKDFRKENVLHRHHGGAHIYGSLHRCCNLLWPQNRNLCIVGGSKIAAVEVTHGKTIAAPTVPTRIEGKDQFKFLGWMTEDGTIWNFEEMPVRKDMTLIAQWEWIPHEEQTGLMLATPLVTRKVAAL